MALDGIREWQTPPPPNVKCWRGFQGNRLCRSLICSLITLVLVGRSWRFSRSAIVPAQGTDPVGIVHPEPPAIPQAKSSRRDPHPYPTPRFPNWFHPAHPTLGFTQPIRYPESLSTAPPFCFKTPDRGGILFSGIHRGRNRGIFAPMGRKKP